MTLALTSPSRYRLLEDKAATELGDDEAFARRTIITRRFQEFSVFERDFGVELDYLIEEQIALLQLAEPRRRSRIEAEEVSALSQLRRFFSIRFGETLLVSVVMSHRRGAAFLWLSEALCRREVELRVALTLEFAIAREELVSFSRAQTARLLDTCRSVGGAHDKKQEVLARLAELRRERQRGILAALLAELEFTHQAERTRIEWSEELERSRVLERSVRNSRLYT